ncbi:MAG: response regulator [Gammaproteobacteria bacterium]|nr:response regulator [Gammaproteobacteria bacterium]
MDKTALIVDDSRSARVVLKRMLEAHDLNVDTAESAEDALDYLCDKRPDVIFMDHMMPGMDGFEAVSAIKNNPDTATIPIMMYTSQEGELYVGQARALGAVGVLPKQIEPVEVSKVLTSLRVIGADRKTLQETPEAVGSTSISGEFPGLETLDQDLRILIKDLFAQQRAVLRRDLLDSYETIASRVADEIRPGNEEPDESQVPNVDEFAPSRIWQFAISLLAFTTIIFGWLYWQRDQDLRDLQAQQASWRQEIEEQRLIDADSTQATTREIEAYQQSVSMMFAANLAALEWGANQAPQYQFGDLPLGDTRLTVVEQLAAHLAAIDFSGVVRIETHVADFCMSATGPDGFELSPGDVPASGCDQLGFALGEAYELGLRQSVAFANFIRLADVRSAGRIRYEIISSGNSDPLMAYPTTAANVNAGTWNEIAARNNRVEISVLADPY